MAKTEKEIMELRAQIKKLRGELDTTPGGPSKEFKKSDNKFIMD